MKSFKILPFYPKNYTSYHFIDPTNPTINSKHEKTGEAGGFHKDWSIPGSHHLNSLQRVLKRLVAWGLKINLHEFLSCYHFGTIFSVEIAGIRPTELVHLLISGVTSGNQPGAYFPLPSIAMFVSESLNPCHFVCCSTESTGFSK